MPKINQEEYEVLKSLDDKWKWVARDEDRDLYAFTKKPVRKYCPSPYWWDVDGWDAEAYLAIGLFDEIHLFQFIQWEDEKPYHIQELIDGYESNLIKSTPWTPNPLDFNESEETEVKKDKKWLVDKWTKERNVTDVYDPMYQFISEFIADVNQLDEPEPKNISLQDVTHRLCQLALNDRKYWLEHLNDEFQEGYIVPLGLKTTDGEEQYLTLNGSYFASRRNRHLQQTFATLEEIPEFYRDLAERVL